MVGTRSPCNLAWTRPQAENHTMPRIVLASTSPYRRELLKRLGLQFECVAPGVDEAAEQAKGLDPGSLARTLARCKADAVAAQHPDAIVIGGDQVIALGTEVLGKPSSAAAAAAQLARLSGQEHAVITACAIVYGKRAEEFADVAMLRMRPLDAAEIARYVALDNPVDCAGAYKIERGGIALFDQITASDLTAITGMPMLRLCAVLRDLGVAVP
jgi:septum formation protein